MDKFIKRFFCVGNYMRHYPGLTMEDIEKQSGIPKMNISHMENNLSSARMGTAIALAKVYGISLDALLRNDFEEMARHLDASPNPEHHLYKKFAKIAQICQQNGLAGEALIFL